MIKAVIFDFYGVLALRGMESFRKTYFKADKEKYDKVEELRDRLGIGTLGYDDYIDELVGLSGVNRDKVLEFTEDYQPNTELLDYIKTKLKPHYKIGIISNAGQDWVLKVLGSEYKKLFDDIVLSYKVGLIKPDTEIYEISANNLGIKPGQAVFVDDILRYCQGAEAIGMSTIWYRNFGQFKSELKNYLSAVSDN